MLAQWKNDSMAQAPAQTDRHSSKRTLIAGFALIVVLLIAISGIAIYVLSDSVTSLHSVANVNERNTRLLHNMQNAARMRIITLYHMSSTEDPFHKDELWMKFNAFGTTFIINRNEFIAAEPGDQVIELLDQQWIKMRPLAELQMKIATLLLNGEGGNTHIHLIKQAARMQDDILEMFGPINAELAKQQKASLSAVIKANVVAKFNIFFIVFLTLVLTLAIAHFVFTRVRGFENSLLREKELALVTLYSVADGVVILDKDNQIREINKKGKELLGCASVDAAGKSLHDITTSISDDELMRIERRLAEGEADSESSTRNEWIELQHSNGELMTVEYQVSPVTINNKPLYKVLVFHDITAIHSLTKQLDYEATHDSLTGLYNRRKFEELLNWTLSDAQRYTEAKSWLCYVDLDEFKQVNDNFGHMAGDKLLVKISDCIRNATRKTDHVARLGGDEFAIILRYSNEEEAIAAAQRIRENILGLHLYYDNAVIDISASLGLVFLGKDIGSLSTALHYADIACYRSKQSGRDQLTVYQDAMAR